MKSGFYRTEIKSDNNRLEKGYFNLRYRYEQGSISATSIKELRNKVISRGLEWRITDQNQANTTIAIEKKLIKLDSEYNEYLTYLDKELVKLKKECCEKENKIIEEKFNRKQLIRQQKSAILSTLQDK